MSGTPIIAFGALFCSDPSKSDWNSRHFRITGVWSAVVFAVTSWHWPNSSVDWDSPFHSCGPIHIICT